VPSADAAMPLREGLAISLAINVPFGFVTDWDDDWMGRFQVCPSKIETINVAPSIAWRPTPQWSIGAGIDYQRFAATLTNSVS
jgi:long-chain fatty acid transport protein